MVGFASVRRLRRVRRATPPVLLVELVDFVFDGREAAEQPDELGAEVLAFTPRRAPDLGGLALGRADQVERRRLAMRAAPARTTLGRLAAVIAPAGQPVEPLPLLRHLAFEPDDLIGERPQGLLREPTDAVHRGSPM